jgi:hypothetical protein
MIFLGIDWGTKAPRPSLDWETGDPRFRATGLRIRSHPPAGAMEQIPRIKTPRNNPSAK